MKVSSYMTQPVITASPDDGVRSAFFTMRERGIRHLPVVAADGKLVGWISDRDLRRPDWVDPDAGTSFGYRLEDDLYVRDLMNSNVVSVHTYDSVHKAVGILLDRKFGAVPVIDKTGALVGVLSTIDLLRAFSERLDADHVESRRGSR